MTIYEHSRKIGFDEESAIAVEVKMQGLISQYLHKNLAQETFNAGYPKYVVNLFSNAQLASFLNVFGNRSFNPDQHELAFKLGNNDQCIKFARDNNEANENEIREFFRKREIYTRETKPKRELEALRELEKGEFWNILNNRVYRTIQRIEMPNGRAHLISIPTGGSPGYKKNFKRR